MLLKQCEPSISLAALASSLSCTFLTDMPGHDSGLCTSMRSRFPIPLLTLWLVPSDVLTPGLLGVTSCNMIFSEAQRFADRPLRLCPGSPPIQGANECKSVRIGRCQTMMREVNFDVSFRRCMKDDLILERCSLKGPIPVILRRSAIAFTQCQCGQK